MNTISAPRKPRKPNSKDKREFLLICHKPCDQCLFSKNKIVSDGTKGLVLEDCERNDKPFNCHKHTIRADAVRGVERAEAKRTYCHGYWTRFRGAHLLFRLADHLGLVRFVDFDGREVNDAEPAHAAD